MPTPVCHCNTKMVELVGWKRLELNKLMESVGCDESNWWSIMRRSLAIQFRGCFVNSAKIQHMGDPDKAARYGVFLMDNDLKSFLQSEPAAACLFKMVRGCMSEVSSSDMLQYLDDYVNELDERFTFKKYGKHAASITIKFLQGNLPNRSGARVAPLLLRSASKLVKRWARHRMTLTLPLPSLHYQL